MEHGTPTLGRRDRKKQATRAAIVEAALDLFEEQGFAATTVDEIAERADVAQRTFFRHFATKEAVLFPDSEEGAARFRAALAARPAGEALLTGVLTAFASSMGDATYHDPALITRRQAIIEQAGDSGDAITWGSIVAGHRIVEEAVAEHAGLDPADEQVQLVTSLGLLLMTQAVPAWYATGADGDLGALLDQKLAALRGIIGP